MLSPTLLRSPIWPSRRDTAWWPQLIALALTLASFSALTLPVGRVAWWTIPAPMRGEPQRERVVLITPSYVPRTTTQAPARKTVVPRVARSRVESTPSAVETPPVDTALRASTPTVTPQTASPLSPSSASSRFLPSRTDTPWYSAPSQRAPFAPAAPLSQAERDSVLEALAANFADLAARRVPTQGERDAAAKEAMLKMRLTGRTLLVPPDNSGGLITARLPLPLFSAGPSRRQRARDKKSFDENQLRLERLRLRADSARRARGDSVRSP